MSRHVGGLDQRRRAVRLTTVGVVWLAGFAAGFVGFLAAVARYGCAAGNDGFACRGSGSVVGWLIVAAVIVIVIAVTITSQGRSVRGVLTAGGVGVLALGVCFIAGRVLLGTA